VAKPDSSDERPPQRLSPREFAKSLRRAMPASERRLWKHLRDRRLAGLKFVRQVPIGKFVVDFLCRERRLIVELDGESHANRVRYDIERQRRLEEDGRRVLRISNDDVMNSLESALAAIVRAAGLDADAWMRGELGRYEFDD
jgi:very-short-patch-repair endonuclease